jgi:hypothetical protein
MGGGDGRGGGRRGCVRKGSDGCWGSSLLPQQSANNINNIIIIIMIIIMIIITASCLTGWLADGLTDGLTD